MPRLLTNGRPRTPHYTAIKPPFALRQVLLTVLAPSLTILASQRYAPHDFKTSPKSHLFLDILVYSVTELETSIDLVRQHKPLQQQHRALQSGFFLLDCTTACPSSVRYLAAEKMMKMRILCSGETGAVNPDGTSAGLKVSAYVWGSGNRAARLMASAFGRIHFKNLLFSISSFFPRILAT